jgi:hypothetical protein
VNYDDDYLVVHKHEVKLTNSKGEVKKVFQGQIFSLKQFSLENII